MIKVIGVRFREAGKVYYFDPGEFEIERGSHVIVETARGIEYGFVVLGNRMVEDDKVVQPLKPVLRPATPEDDEIELANKVKEKEAFAICQEKIQARGLEMKLIDAEYTFDNNKVLFYFTADGRIDFRELVKDLAAVFRTRIELRQIGVRDETKILGGVGICGRPFCCHTFLSEFAPVSIKMAKEQNLSLNPTKISGTCGRLMCCLKNEEETYEYLNSKLPYVGDRVIAKDGVRGEVSSVNVLRQTVKLLVSLDGDEKELKEYSVDDLKFRPRRHKCKCEAASEDVLAASSEEFDEEFAAVEMKAAGSGKNTGEGTKPENREGGKKRSRDRRGKNQGQNQNQMRGEADLNAESADRAETASEGLGAEGAESTHRERNSRPNRRNNDRRDNADRKDNPERKENAERRDGSERRDNAGRRDRRGNTDRRENSDRRDDAERRDNPDHQEQTARRESAEENSQEKKTGNERSGKGYRRPGRPFGRRRNDSDSGKSDGASRAEGAGQTE